MGDQLNQFFIDIFQHIPTSFSVGMLLVFCVGTVLLMAFLGFRKGLRWSAVLLLAEYLLLLLVSSVLTRTVQAERMFDFMPFWSYRAIREGDEPLLLQNIMNVAVFIPIGFLLCCSFRRLKWWQVLSIGAGFSLLIEVLQFVFKRGFAEFDDVFHNVLGCAIGYGVYLVVAWVVKPRERLSKTNN